MQPGDVFTHPYPFIRTTYTVVEEDGSYETPSWRPGIRRRPEDRHPENAEADGVGEQLLRVVAVCILGGRYQDRVFYAQSWIDPDGKAFGKGTLRTCTRRKFQTLTQGYAYPYSLPGQPSVWDQQQAEYAAALAASYEAEAMDPNGPWDAPLEPDPEPRTFDYSPEDLAAAIQGEA